MLSGSMWVNRMLFKICTLALVTWVGSAVLFAQRLAFRGAGSQGGMQDRFEASSSDEGEKLPDVEVFDSKGQPLRLSSLKASYTVLILGWPDLSEPFV